MTETAPIPTFPAAALDRRRELRVKIRSLAEEARIIRREERRCRDSIERTSDEFAAQRVALDISYRSLRDHRTGVVRYEARYSQLAYAMIRGKAFRAVEKNSSVASINLDKLLGLVERFGPRVGRISTREVLAWLNQP